MRRIPGVQDVKPSAQFGISVVGDPGLSAAGAFWATPRVPWVQPRVTVAFPGIPTDHALADDEVYLPDTHPGTTSTSLLGKRITIQYTKATGPSQGEAVEATVHVIGLFDNSMPGADGETAVYVSDSLFRTLLSAQLGLTQARPIPDGYAYPTVYVKASSTDRVAPVQSALVRMGFNAQSLAAQTQELPGVLRLVSRLDDVLGAVLLLFCVGVGLSLGGTWSALRRWDVGLLASLGWSRARILGSYTSEIFIIGLAVGLGSAVLGCLVSQALGLALSGHELLGATFSGGLVLPPPLWLIAVLVGIPLALMVGSVTRLLRLASLAPDVALRRRD
jgi:hypothetical protein